MAASTMISLLLLITLISPFPALADVNWSIDCGSSDASYLDDNLIIWQGDDSFISTGQSRTTIANAGTVMSTLWVFTSGKKNCYVLAGQKGAKLMLRASFFYGNYDGKSDPPTFDLQLDGNDWASVVTDMETETVVYYEATYVAKGDSISLCLVQTDSKYYPFISALEVRTLDSRIYSSMGSDQALSLGGRHAFGANKEIRFSSDAYDRIWGAATLTGTEFTAVQSTASFIDPTTVADNPPAEAVSNAMTTSNSSAQSLKFFLSDLDVTPYPVYINMYFSEVSSLDTTEKRAFTVYFDNKIVDSTSKGISPKYGSVGEVTIYNAVATNSTTIELRSTSDSTLPPIINAIETFLVFNYTVYKPEKSSSGSGSSGGSPSTPTLTSTDSSGTSKKSKLPVILGVSIPGFLLLGAFAFVLVTMQQKRQRAAMAAGAAPGGDNGQGGAFQSNNNGQMSMAGKFGQEMINEYRVEMNEQAAGQDDSNNQLPYGSPAPLLNQTR